MINITNIQNSIISYVKSFTISGGISVIDGGSYGVNLNDPRGKIPSIAIDVEDITQYDLELGSTNYEYFVSITVNELNKNRRDATTTYVVNALERCSYIDVYSKYDNNSINITNDVISSIEPDTSTLQYKPMPNFDTDREKFFWVSVITLKFISYSNGEF